MNQPINSSYLQLLTMPIEVVCNGGGALQLWYTAAVVARRRWLSTKTVTVVVYEGGGSDRRRWWWWCKCLKDEVGEDNQKELIGYLYLYYYIKVLILVSICIWSIYKSYYLLVFVFDNMLVQVIFFESH